MAGLTRFFVSTPSRHPAQQKAYDSDGHRYKPDYVSPRFWRLDLTFLPQGFSEGSDGVIMIPREIVSLLWTVKQIDGAFSVTIPKEPPSSETIVSIPEPGEYAITLQVNLANGQAEVNTRNYRLRDFLVVGIGDSFASGQGNPDVPAVPAPDQRAICRATTLALLIANIDEKAKQFARGLLEGVEDVVEFAPFLGKIVVGALNNVENLAGFVKGGIDDLKDFAVSVGREIESAVVEGAQEFAQRVLGIGGGASSEDDPHPAAWQEPNAYRSYSSGQSLAARQAETATGFGADRITFLSFARTGSEIRDGLLGPRTIDPGVGGNLTLDAWTGNRGQIEEAKDNIGPRPIDALIVSVGVNDLGFSSQVSEAILRKKGSARTERIQEAEDKIANRFPDDLDSLKRAIDSQLSPAKVFITEYPVGIFKEVADEGPCGVLASEVILDLDLDVADAKALGRLGGLLNARIREKANEFGWIFVDGIEADFDGHGYCASRPYFVSAEESCLNQGDFEGMLHPNKLGHQATRDRIALALRKEVLAPREQWLEPVLHVMMS